MDSRTAATVRAYLEGLTGDQRVGDSLFVSFLSQGGSRRPQLVEVLRDLHEWLSRDAKGFVRACKPTRQSLRLIYWHLDGFSAGERAIVLLAGLPTLTADDVPYILGTDPEHVQAVIADATRRVGGFAVAVVARQDVVARDIDGILCGFGITRCQHLPDIAAIEERQAAACELLVADVEGLSTRQREWLANRARLQHGTPVVVLTSGEASDWRGATVVRKPFSARGLRDGVLDAIGA